MVVRITCHDRYVNFLNTPYYVEALTTRINLKIYSRYSIHILKLKKPVSTKNEGINESVQIKFERIYPYIYILVSLLSEYTNKINNIIKDRKQRVSLSVNCPYSYDSLSSDLRSSITHTLTKKILNIRISSRTWISQSQAKDRVKERDKVSSHLGIA